MQDVLGCKDQQHARRSFGGRRIDRTDMPRGDGALHQYGVGKVGGVMLESIERGALDLRRTVEARYPRAERRSRRRTIRCIPMLWSGFKNGHAMPPILRIARATTRGARS